MPPGASAQETAELYASLRIEELALARACAAGHERAWEIFMSRYREKLYDIAAYIAKESSAARELADSLYADLYGTTLATASGFPSCLPIPAAVRSKAGCEP